MKCHKCDKLLSDEDKRYTRGVYVKGECREVCKECFSRRMLSLNNEQENNWQKIDNKEVSNG
jgi:hypothetical protein